MSEPLAVQFHEDEETVSLDRVAALLALWAGRRRRAHEEKTA